MLIKTFFFIDVLWGGTGLKTTYTALSADHTEKIAADFSRTLKGQETVALFGGLGMGKTAFVRGLAKGMGLSDAVSSPTFALVHEYNQGPTPLFHFDMYRIIGYDDLYSTGFFDYQNHGIIVCEWSENILNALPEDCIRITLALGDTEEQRMITIEREEN